MFTSDIIMKLVKEDLLKRVTMNPKVSFGKPAIRNMRYLVEIMLDLLAAGMMVDEILEDYPDLEKAGMHPFCQRSSSCEKYA